MIKDLTLADATQHVLLEHLKETEQMLARVATQVSGCEMSATIYALPDLGIPQNVTRIRGGFFTGALYTWETDVPFVPIDSTVNSCGVAVYRLSRPLEGSGDFMSSIYRAMYRCEQEKKFQWNFATGNHFITYGSVHGSPYLTDGHYLVLHASACEFKDQQHGLYPTDGNWYSDSVKILQDDHSPRYLRYISGITAEKFMASARYLDSYNTQRMQYFAELVAGPGNVEAEILNLAHYGMPNPETIAIGCQWKATPYLLLTAPSLPLYLISPDNSGENQLSSRGDYLLLNPHGLGVACRFPLRIQYGNSYVEINGERFASSESLRGHADFAVRDFSLKESEEGIPALIQEILARCPGKILAKMIPEDSYCAPASAVNVNLAHLQGYAENF